MKVIRSQDTIIVAYYLPGMRSPCFSWDSDSTGSDNLGLQTPRDAERPRCRVRYSFNVELFVSLLNIVLRR